MEGQGYTETWLPTPEPANHFPPGYPALLAAWMGLVGTSVFAAKLLSGVALFGVVSATYALSGMVTGDRRIALLVTAAAGLNAAMLRYGSLVMSEVPFALASLLALLALVRAREALSAKGEAGWLAAVVLNLAASYYLRSIGLFLVGGIIGGAALRGRWREAGIVAGGFALLALPWFLYGRVFAAELYRFYPRGGAPTPP